MRSEHVEVLVRFELKRTWPMVFRLFGFVAFVHIFHGYNVGVFSRESASSF